MDNIDIFQSARLYIDQYGADASIEAAKTSEALMKKDDEKGSAVWMQIGRAIEELQATEGLTKH